MINLTEQEKQELSQKFKKVVINEMSNQKQDTVTLSTGRIVKGVITQEGIIISEATELLFG